MKKLLKIMCVFFYSVLSSQNIGDAGYIFDSSKSDSNYSQMKRWALAGIKGGIVKVSELDEIKTINPTNSDGLQREINKLEQKGGGVLKLNRGVYKIDKQLNLKKNVRISGVNRDEVIFRVTLKKPCGWSSYNSAIKFAKNVSNSGLENLTVEGGYGTPWGFRLTNAKEDFCTSMIWMEGSNCFLDRINVYKSGNHPVVVSGNHNTVRNGDFQRTWNKGSGGRGYFVVTGSDNLIYNNHWKLLRHMSLQNPSSKYNVVFGNFAEQDINFHVKDGGNNLIERNKVRLPSYHGNSYYGIMGPWSTNHDLSLKDNYLYKNDVIEHNHDNKRVFIRDAVYLGPRRKYRNFWDYTRNTPRKGHLYAVKYEKKAIRSKKGNSSFVTDKKSVTIGQGNKLTLSVSPNSSDYTWNWTGPKSFNSSSKKIIIDNVTKDNEGLYIANYKHKDGAKGKLKIRINVKKRKIEDGCYYLQFKHSNKYLTNTAGNNNIGNVKHQNFIGNGKRQRFNIVKSSDGDGFLIKSGEKALEVSSSSLINGGNIAVYTLNTNAPHMRWYFEKAEDGYYYIKNKKSKKYVSEKTTNDIEDTEVHQWDLGFTDNQKFKLIKCSEINNFRASELSVTPRLIDSNEEDIINFPMIYPNPSKGLFYLKLDGVVELSSVQVINMKGDVLYANENTIETKKYKMDLRNFEAGIYFLRFKINQISYTKTIIISY